MATYKAEHGFQIKHRSSDPPSPIAGEIWYNSTTQTLKCAPEIAAWSSGGNLSTARASGMYTGTQTANLLAGGYATTMSNTSVTYDGSSWTAAPNLSENPRRSNAGGGTTTAAFSVGGSIGPLPPTANTVNTVEEFDGSSWTAGGDYPLGVYDLEACGTLTAGLGSGGYKTPSDPGEYINTNADYNGTSWTANNNMNTARANYGFTGSQTAALAAGGNNPTMATSETYDGTNWTAITNLPAARKMHAASGPSSQGLIFGGSGASPYLNTSILWDGSSWAAQPNMATVRQFGHGSHQAPGTAALSAGGYVNPGLSTATEEYNLAATTRSVDTS